MLRTLHLPCAKQIKESGKFFLKDGKKKKDLRRTVL
jgi:hypothetical protein